MNKIITTAVLLLVIVSCKKYDEGPSLSFRSKSARLENSWKYEKILVDEKEKVLSTEDMEFRLKFDKEGTAIKEVYNASGTASYVGDWIFNDHKEKLQTTFDYSYFGNQIHEVTEYTILKLKHKELWLEEIKVNGDTCEYHFIPE